MNEIAKMAPQPCSTRLPGELEGLRIAIATNGIDVTETGRLLTDSGCKTISTMAASIFDADLIVLLSKDSWSVVDMLDGELSNSRVPIVVACGDSAPASASRCILHGADDYLVYPFNDHEFLARIYGAIRRYCRDLAPWARGNERGPFIQFRSSDCSILVNGTGIRLTDAQFGIMSHLLAVRGQWVRTAVLQNDVLKATAAAGASNVRFHILRLRRALGDWAGCLHGRQRLGYMWSDRLCESPHCMCRRAPCVMVQEASGEHSSSTGRMG